MDNLKLIYREWKANLELDDSRLVAEVETTIKEVDGCPEVVTRLVLTRTVAEFEELDNAVYLGTLSSAPDIYSEYDKLYIAAYVNLPGELLYMVQSSDGIDWDLYSTNGVVPDTAKIMLDVGKGEDDKPAYLTVELPIDYADYAGMPTGLGVYPARFAFKRSLSSEYVGDIVYNDAKVRRIVSAAYDSEDTNFAVEYVVDKMYGYQPSGHWELRHNGLTSDHDHVAFNVPILYQYEDAASGRIVEDRTVLTVHGFNSVSAQPAVKFITNLASKVNTVEQVTLHGWNFNTDMDIQLSLAMGDGSTWTKTVPHGELVFGNDGVWDTVSFVMSSELAYRDNNGDEVCNTYKIMLGYGDDIAFEGLAGSDDPKMSFENNLGLIRYKYDESNEESRKVASAGAAPTTNSPCFYTSTVTMKYDSTDSNGNPYLNGGASGKYGKTMYVRIPRGAYCEQYRYYRVKMKYNKNLNFLKGEMTLNGVYLKDGDIVWLAGQVDGNDGLWVVRNGQWVGLSTLIDGMDDPEYDPCTSPQQVPLKVTDNVFVDLGATVGDDMNYRCGQDVPVKYGAQYVCGRLAEPGDLLLLANQSDNYDGIWEVTCAEWIYRGPVKDDGTTHVDMSDDILVQNNIDFCSCSGDGKGGLYKIEYFYMNAGCYLAKATRNVKVLCAGLGRGSLFPDNNYVVTDYSITAGADKDLIVDTDATAGDQKNEDCTKPVDNYESDNRINSRETSYECGDMGNVIVAPTCEKICDCPRFYKLEQYEGNVSTYGFSIVFWQFDEDDGWHLYAYIGSGRYDTGIEYYVYHLHTCGIALPRNVDENRDVYILDDRGLPTSKRTKDAWFVPHGGVLADGFGMVDKTWNLNKVMDETGTKWTGEYTYSLDAESLYGHWNINPAVTLTQGTEDDEPETGSPRDLLTQGTYILATLLPDGHIQGMPHTYGFRFYRDALTKERFCNVFNEDRRENCPCWTDKDAWGGLVTDQCYDAEGNIVDCQSGESLGGAFITDENGNAFVSFDNSEE